MLFARDGEEFVAHRNARGDCLFTKTLSGFRKTAGYTVCQTGEGAIGEARLDVWLENHSWDAVHTRCQNHWPGSVAADAEGDVEIMPLHNFLRVPQSRRQLCQVARQFRSAHAFQARRANRFQRQAGLRHEPGFHSGFGSDEHNATFSFRHTPQPFPRHGDGGKYVAAGAAACNQQAFTCGAACRHVSSACWLMFNSTPVANNMLNRLEPP